MSKPIYLIGYMACGKTTLSRALSISCGVEACDLDEEIERISGMSVAEFFARHGEDEFRKLERRILSEISARYAGRDVVISCGGGTACNPESMRLMLDTGLVVWLRADVGRTLARLASQAGKRPRLKGLEGEQLRNFIENEMTARSQYYSLAHKSFDSSSLDSIDEINASVTKFIKEICPSLPRLKSL